jgi:pSer/pThr/pTyr-binding forkhead associated (FHA) protein
MNCNNCGSPVEPGKKFCGECGQPVAVEPPPTEAPPPLPDDIPTLLFEEPSPPEEIWVLARPGQDPIILGDSTMFGRGTDCDQILEDTQASRRHALIEKGEEGFTLTDQESSNGTFVNEERIYGPVLLAEGDEVRIGQTMFTFERAGDEEPAKPAVKADEPKAAPVEDEVKIVEPVMPISQSLCPECGASLTPGIAFCGACGHQMEAAPAVAQPQVAAPGAWDPEDSLEPQPLANPKRLHFSRKGLGIGCLVIVGLGITMLCFLYVLEFLIESVF